MTDERDEIDAWLRREVTPLYPQPGSFERIRRRAKARKRRQAITAAAGCAVLVAAVAAGPHLASLLNSNSGKTAAPTAGRQRLPARRVLPASSPTGGGNPDASETRRIQTASQRTRLTHSWTKPPGNFQPTSVTFVGNGAGGTIGAVIGQAGIPGHCATKDCTSLAGTANYGRNWYGVSAPLAPGADRPAGVSQLRFANTADGWAFGPTLYETTGGGWPWKRVATNGLVVTDLEAAGQQAFVLAARCASDTASFAGDCASFSVYALTAGSTKLTPVPVPPAYQQMTTAKPASASLVIAGYTTVYVLTPSGALLTGPVAGGNWTVAGSLPSGCAPGPAQADGQPSGAQLAAGQNKSGQKELLLTCESSPSGGTTRTVLYSSPDGAKWTMVRPVTPNGQVTSLATSAAGQAVVATTDTILYLAPGGTTWQPASFGNHAPPVGGFSYVGMTNQSDGVAVPENAELGEIFVTSDGGVTWQASPIVG